MILTLEQAESLAERTLAAIPTPDDDHDERLRWLAEVDAYCRERIASDLAGLREVVDEGDQGWHHRRYSDGLISTARLYGVEP